MAGTSPGCCEVEIRPPRAAEWAACRMLLPDVFGRGVFENSLAPRVLLAFESSAPMVLGAIAFQTRRNETCLMGMRVIRTHRRRKIGTRLLEAALSESPGTSVSVFADSKAHPNTGPFLEANGFERGNRMFIVEVGLDPMVDAMTKLRDRAIQSGRVPQSARFVRPAEAPAGEAIALYQEIMAGRWIHPAHLEASLTDPRIAELSSVLLVDSHVAGMLVARSAPRDDRVHVQARAVMPAFRGGWANVLIMADALEKGRAFGIRRIRFDATDDNQDTLKLARRFNADTISVFDRFTRRV